MRIPENPLDFLQACVRSGQLRWTYHAAMRMAQRGLTAEELIDAVGSFEILEQYPDDKYLPSYLVRAEAHGRVFHAQIAADTESHNVRIVTMYVPDRTEWSADMRTRRKAGAL